ncbi:MAG: LysM peptidoglycan-binding domain-containing protein [Chloroflexi bacterium]|nr:LysM peptidoglycan-binding domain-containing protein [Chloroflexota bacterium]MBP7591164.1 LysM peptidoglycan-binding domain-containing protein [Chloroflexota bacterium]
MVSGHRFIWLTIFLLGAGWLLTACERPSPDASVSPTAVSGLDFSDPNVGGGIAGDAAPTIVAAYPAAPEETMLPATQPLTVTAVTPMPTALPAVPTATTPIENAPAPTDGTAMAADGTAVAADGTAVSEAPIAAAATTTEITHVVQPGENLFRIGLQYGVSWVTLAQYNGLTNPNGIVAGQTIKIPPTTGQPPTSVPTPTATAIPPGSITYYIVQPGDNLFRIGQKFGVSWVQIAEANGLINPNQIVAGQTLKIPVNAPGPTPEFTHVVKFGETIFGIAAQYGVPWLAIAEANDIPSPYVIFAGQALIIPGG